MKLVENVRVAPGIEVVGLTRGQAPRPAAVRGESRAEPVKTANDARLERPQFSQRPFGLQSDKGATGTTATPSSPASNGEHPCAKSATPSNKSATSRSRRSGNGAFRVA